MFGWVLVCEKHIFRAQPTLKNKLGLKRIYVSIDHSPRNPNKNTFWKKFHQRLVTPRKKQSGTAPPLPINPNHGAGSSGNLPKLLRAFFVGRFTGLKPKKRNRKISQRSFPADFSRDLSTRPGDSTLKTVGQKTWKVTVDLAFVEEINPNGTLNDRQFRNLTGGLVGDGGMDWWVGLLGFFAKKLT